MMRPSIWLLAATALTAQHPELQVHAYSRTLATPESPTARFINQEVRICFKGWGDDRIRFGWVLGVMQTDSTKQSKQTGPYGMGTPQVYNKQYTYQVGGLGLTLGGRFLFKPAKDWGLALAPELRLQDDDIGIPTDWSCTSQMNSRSSALGLSLQVQRNFGTQYFLGARAGVVDGRKGIVASREYGLYGGLRLGAQRSLPAGSTTTPR